MGQGGMKGADPQLVLFLTPVCTADSSENVHIGTDRAVLTKALCQAAL